MSSKEYMAAWRSKNRDKCRTYGLAYWYRNRDRLNAERRATKDPEKVREYYLRYRSKDVSKFNARANATWHRRRARLMQACPSWVDHTELNAIYHQAAELGMTVDHIVPLQGKNVCGLHVPWNLQLLTQSENSKKGNRYVG